MATKWIQLIGLRKAAGLSQYELAHQLKISRSALGNYEMGEREPDFETIKKFASFFGVTVDHLLGRSGSAPSDENVDGGVPTEWRQVISQARSDGFSPDQVLQALKLLESIRRQQEGTRNDEREG